MIAKFHVGCQARFAGSLLQAALIFSICSSMTLADSDADGVKPRQTIRWKSTGGGLWNSGTAGDYVYAVADLPAPAAVDVWKWENGTLKKAHHVLVNRYADGLVVLPNDRYFSCLFDSTGEKEILVVKDLKSGRDVRSWPADPEWHGGGAVASPGGKIVTVWKSPSISNHTYEVGDAVLRIGIFPTAGDTITWLPPLRFEPGSYFETVVVSDDGAYLIMPTSGHGVSLVDIRAKKVIWHNGEKGVDYCDRAAFGPGNRVVYTGGRDHVVYGLDVRNGQIVSRWDAWVGETVFPLSSVSASPDGRYVAAGTQWGDIAIFATKTGKCVQLLNHEKPRLYLTGFSSDSRSFVSLGGCGSHVIHVWDTSLWSEKKEDTTTH